MGKNPLLELESLGQSIWMDFIRRGTISSGELEGWIRADGVSGVTSNPSIFEKAIGGSHDYDEAIRALALEGLEVPDIYQALTVEDIQQAADRFRPLYDRTHGGDGYVSLEVSPGMAHDTQGTISEAQMLWERASRPNVMIKVPATLEGLGAIEELTGQGINVNVTLLFGLPRYQKVAEAYIAGLEKLNARGKPLDKIASVASFFLSRIDVLIDPLLDKKVQAGGPEAEIARHLQGKIAIASARVAYQMYKEIFFNERFQRLVEHGARPQRLLWASTSTKNPAYKDVMYVDALIGPQTINTLPLETLDAYRDHGDPAPRLEQDVQGAREDLESLARLGFDLDALTQQLEDEGVQKFAKSFDQLTSVLKEKREAALKEPVDHQEFQLGKEQGTFEERLKKLENDDFAARLWRKDPELWKSDPGEQKTIQNGLGWLHVPEKMEENLPALYTFLDEIRSSGFHHVVHIGMGGSSLAPLVFERMFTPSEDGLPLTVLDTTDPATILQIEARIPLEHTLFIIASKSGTTAEPNALGDYFFEKVQEIKGEQAGENFVAITDPGTPLVNLAEQRRFRRVFLNYPDIGGRYSALSYFGLLPAVLMGLDANELLIRAMRMEHACASCVPVPDNPGLRLGAAMGELALRGRDKVTFIAPHSLQPLGMWLEQLLAESTGKQGTGLLPVAGEPLGDPSVYGEDRLFIHFRLKGEEQAELERGAEALRAAGQPLIEIDLKDRMDIGQEFYRWEVAAAAAGSILGINAFDQPDVQESKENTERLLKKAGKDGRLPEEMPVAQMDSLSLYVQGEPGEFRESLCHFMASAQPGDYIALMAFLPEQPGMEEQLEAIRVEIRNVLHLGTTLGYGPRFLHSTGQYHKGGPDSGLFIQLTESGEPGVPIPGKPYSFGLFKRAQAQGDLESLRKHGRRVIRIDLGNQPEQSLAELRRELESILTGEVTPC